MHTPPLPADGWLPINHRALVALCARARHAKEAGRPLTCAFDWDHTCILGDLGDQTLVHQVEVGAFAIGADEAGARLSAWPQVPRAVVDDIVEAWRACADAARQPGAPPTWPRAAPSAHADLAARLLWAVGEVLRGAGADTGRAYLWQAGWLDGLDGEGLDRLVAEAWRRGLAAPLAPRLWQTASAGRGGHRRARWPGGLRRCPEMEGLLAALAAAGAEVWVVTASHQGVVGRLAAALGPATGGALSPARVVGMRPGVAGAPVTWRQGKVEAIARLLPSPPALVAGDADTDFDMLVQQLPPDLALIIHRGRPPPMDRLYRAAREQAAGAARATDGRLPHVLLQGRDEATGHLVASPWRLPLAGQ